MKINIVSSKNSWINPYLKNFCTYLKKKNINVRVLNSHNKIKNSDISFFLSYWNIVPENILKFSKFNLVVHESNLPKGKGWSPISWQILEGKKKIIICLIDASKNVDSGHIYLKKEVFFKGNELINEIRKKQAKATISLCKNFLSRYKNGTMTKIKQKGTSTYY
jgi:Methionyl-tRNA formyltransferase